MTIVLALLILVGLAINSLTLFAIGVLMSTQADLVSAVADIDTAVTALENKPDSTPGSGVVDQPTLDKAVSDLQAFKIRIDAETAAK